MVSWQSQAEIAKDELAFEKLIYALFGLYVWELFQTSGVEWSLIVTRQRKFMWPMSSFIQAHFLFNVAKHSSQVFYFLCRYCMLWALIGLIISFNVTRQVNCEALYTFNSWTGNMAILCASTSLMIRTIAIWERKLTVVIPLLILCLAHWGLLYHGIIIVRATWDPVQSACVVNQTDSAILKFTFFATMGFDLIIFGLTCFALLRNSSRSGLWHLLFRDGLIYWVVTFSVNAIPAILNSLNLNTPMNIIATVPAATVSSIAASRCVVRLQDYRNQDVYMSSTGRLSQQGGTSVGVNTVDGRRVVTRFNAPGGNSAAMPIFARPEVHIRTDQITMDNLGAVEYEDTNVSSATTADTLKTSRDLEEGLDRDEDVKINREVTLFVTK